MNYEFLDKHTFQGSSMTTNAPHRIDTHHHIVPPKYFAAEREKILGAAIGGIKV